jgi:hypothetical protein
MWGSRRAAFWTSPFLIDKISLLFFLLICNSFYFDLMKLIVGFSPATSKKRSIKFIFDHWTSISLHLICSHVYRYFLCCSDVSYFVYQNVRSVILWNFLIKTKVYLCLCINIKMIMNFMYFALEFWNYISS